MKVEGIRIKNYKSITDSRLFTVGGKCTVLMGRNGSGKSSVIEALEYLAMGRRWQNPPVRGLDPSRHHPSPRGNMLPFEIGIKIQYSQNDILALSDEKEGIVLSLSDCANKFYSILESSGGEFELYLIGGDNYFWRQPSKYLLEPSLSDIALAYNKSAIRINSTLAGQDMLWHECVLPMIGGAHGNCSIYDVMYSAHNLKANIADYNLEDNVGDIDEIIKLLHSLGIQAQSYPPALLVEKWVPQFHLSVSHLVEFPDTINIESEDLESDDRELNFIGLLRGMGILKAGEIPGHNSPIEHFNAELRANLQPLIDKYISPQIRLFAESNPNGLVLKFENTDNICLPSEESTGIKKMLLFVMELHVYAYDKEKHHVVLLDEPDTHLHHSFQQNLIRLIDDTTGDGLQVIYTTHSPHIVDARHFNRIRTVERTTGDGTIVLDKSHHGKDGEDGISNVLQAIQFDPTFGLAPFADMNNVVVEGINDQYTFEGFRQLLMPELQVCFISGGGDSGGASNMILIGNILRSRKAKVLFIADNDKDGRGARDDIVNDGYTEEDVLLVSPVKGHRLEELFSPSDLHLFQSEDGKIDGKKFLDACEADPELELDASTRDNAKALFDQLNMRVSG